MGRIRARAEKAVGDDGQRQQQQNQLHRGSGVTPPEKASDARPRENVYAAAPRCHAQVH